MPAFQASATIASAVASVQAQSFADWEVLIVADDATDYEKVLAEAGLRDPRLRFLGTGRTGSGSSTARNMGLEAAGGAYLAVLDADDRFKPEKLARFATALVDHPIVSCALDVVDAGFGHLRHVGTGPDRFLPSGAHKWTNFSMDSMIAWDRRRCDGRYDPGLGNMTDLELLLQLYRTAPGNWHIGTPLHDYVKLPVSLSNGPGVTERMLAAKTLLIERLKSGYYSFADSATAEGVGAFLRISMQAEAAYPAALEKDPSALFEDTIEPLIHAFKGI